MEAQLSQAVSQLLVTVEAYPELKSNTNFLELQRELTDTEDRIAAARRFYNANVRDYNTKVESVPSNIIAGFAKFEKATYFELNDPIARQAPDVNFGEISQRPTSQQARRSRPSRSRTRCRHPTRTSSRCSSPPTGPRSRADRSASEAPVPFLGAGRFPYALGERDTPVVET
ncbi:LemA family protein [Tessaracoccus coleopterorum]|uniref:LemA family protein n=1 Tax=Tessaracoccus coleopterorum TaxID=2714950 RepID=UPI002F9166EC